jgi:hypothetical protein
MYCSDCVDVLFQLRNETSVPVTHYELSG